MKFKINALLILTILASIGLWSCGPKKDEANNEQDDYDKAGKSLKEEIKDLAYSIPPPSEIPYMLQATGAEYNQSLINDRKKADGYSQTDTQALNLGVYTADIGYLSVYEKTQESIDYLNVCKGLADKLGVSGSFDRATLEKFEANIGNRDSLAALLNNAVKTTDKYLKDDNRSKLGALLVAGSFVESLYLSTGIIKTYPKDLLPDDKRNLILTPLMMVVINQRKSVSEVAKMLSEVDQTGPIPAIVADLKSLEASYAASNLEEQIKNNKANLTLTDKTLQEITKTVEKLRSDIVQ